MKHRIELIIFTFLITLFCFPINTIGFEEDEHNEYMEKVLFGERASLQPKLDKEIIKSLEYASYLCVDQCNSHLHPNDEKKIEFLKKRKIDKIPELSEIDFKGNQWHRIFTHKGWDYNYGNKDEAHWEKRKELLLNTVNKELSFSFFSNKLWFKYDPKCEHFAALLYYIHVLGDHIDNTWETKDTGFGMIHLADAHDTNNSLIDELEKHLKELFKDQKKSSYAYDGMMDSLDEIKTRAASVENSTGGINTVEKFDIYHQCAVDLMDVLIERVPTLLKHEEFFSKTFYE